MTKKKIKICFVSHSSQKFGAERSLLETVLMLKEYVDIFVLLPKYGPLCEEFTKNNIDHAIIPYSWWVAKQPKFFKSIAKIFLNSLMIFVVAYYIKKHKCDMVYTNTSTVCVGAFAAKILLKPHFWHIREYGFEDHGLVFELGKKFSLRMIHRLSHHCFVNSQAIFDRYATEENDTFTVLYQPVALYFGESVALDSRKCICMILGAVRPSKGQEDAVEAVHVLKEHYNCDVCLYIVGNGDEQYTAYLKEKVSKYKIDAQVFFTGYVHSPASWLEKADIVLVCSRKEAFGRVTIESFLLNKPVIGADSGGTTELIRAAQGELYTPGNVKELAHKIHCLVQDENLRREVALRGHEWHGNNISPKIFVQKILKVVHKFSNI